MSDYKSACPKCRSKGLDKSGDNLVNYGDGKGAYCFSCGYTKPSDDRKAELGIDKFEWTDEMESEVSTKEL